jgi:predicted TIM-barrel fold metal-dependent hydrolase
VVQSLPGAEQTSAGRLRDDAWRSGGLDSVLGDIRGRKEWRLPTKEQKPYVEHFKKFSCDTAVFGFAPKILDIVVDFFGPDRVLFGSDSPMDVTGGQYFTSETLRSIDAMSISPELRRAILAKNASRVLKIA